MSEKPPQFTSAEQAHTETPDGNIQVASSFLQDPETFVVTACDEYPEDDPVRRINHVVQKISNAVSALVGNEVANTEDTDIAAILAHDPTTPESETYLFRLLKRAGVPAADVEVWVKSLSFESDNLSEQLQERGTLARFRRVYSEET